ncbi:HAD-like domain-containing protein [Irpex lacteus]|nr:HAD-like domain-containing protein [Irpex lacteus]
MAVTSTDAVTLPRCRTIIMDIGDVLVTMSLNTTTTIPPKTLRAILSSPTWAAYECGRLTESECYHLVAEEYTLAVEEVTNAFNQDVRGSITLNQPLFAFLRQLKGELGPSLRLCVMSNISQSDIDLIAAKHPKEWSLFDDLFPSCRMGVRKPSLSYYQQVLKIIGGDPKDTVFVDDKAEHVMVAQSFGMRGVVYSQLEDFRRAIRSLTCDPIRRGIDFLRTHTCGFDFAASGMLGFIDGLTLLLAQDGLKERGFAGPTNLSHQHQIPLPSGPSLNFIVPISVLTDVSFPSVIGECGYNCSHAKILHATLDAVLEHRDDDGIIRTFVDAQCGRLDPVICANVLALFHLHGRGSQLKDTEAWVCNALRHRSYLDGTRYYTLPESFLYSVSRLIKVCQDGALRKVLEPLLQERLQERIGLPSDIPALTLRVVACAAVGISPATDVQQLLSLQLEDGSWTSRKIDPSASNIGGRCIATALALKAVGIVVESSSSS